MKDVYLRAANGIANDRYLFSCEAVLLAGVDGGVRHIKCLALTSYYADLFGHFPVLNTGCWLDRAVEQRRLKKSEMKDWRITALLFMHWIYQDELKARTK